MDCSIPECSNKSVSKGLCDKHRKRISRHGHADQTRPIDWGKREAHPLYKVWTGMKRRCTDPKYKDYINYGARGIMVDARWNDFWVFVSDMGDRPSNRHSIGRINNDGHYTPSNCRWETAKEQARNRRNAVITQSIADEIKRRSAAGEKAGDISRSLGVHYDNVRSVIIGDSFG